MAKIKIPKTTYLRVKVIPNSSKNHLREILLDQNQEKTIKIAIQAPAEKGKANKELIKFLSKELNTSKSSIKILNGHKTQLKLLKIDYK